MADIQAVELLTIVVGPETDKGNSWRLRLVQWVVDGVSKSVKLERRKFFKDAYGDTKTGKAEGFSLRDLEACKEHWPKIMALMKSPPAVVEKPEIVKKAEEMMGEGSKSSDMPF